MGGLCKGTINGNLGYLNFMTTCEDNTCPSKHILCHAPGDNQVRSSIRMPFHVPESPHETVIVETSLYLGNGCIDIYMGGCYYELRKGDMKTGTPATLFS